MIPLQTPSDPAPKAGVTRRLCSWLVSLLPWIPLFVIVFVLRPGWLGGDATVTIVSGHSMERTYHTGDLIIASPKKVYKVGDVVIYKIPSGVGMGRQVVHRIHTKNADGTMLAQGDHNPTPDPWTITEKDIIGAKDLMIAKGGLVLGFFRSIAGLALLVGVLVAWVMWPRGEDEESNGVQAQAQEPEPVPVDPVQQTESAPAVIEAQDDERILVGPQR